MKYCITGREIPSPDPEEQKDYIFYGYEVQPPLKTIAATNICELIKARSLIEFASISRQDDEGTVITTHSINSNNHESLTFVGELIAKFIDPTGKHVVELDLQ